MPADTTCISLVEMTGSMQQVSPPTGTEAEAEAEAESEAESLVAVRPCEAWSCAPGKGKRSVRSVRSARDRGSF